jgi:hypothetical protein
MDNSGTHSKQEVRAWLKKHPRFRLHFVPTGCSWLNLGQRWFRELPTPCIRRAAFFSVEDRKQAILEFLATWNENPKPFVCTATADSIMQNCRAAGKPWRKFSPGLPCHAAERRSCKLSRAC